MLQRVQLMIDKKTKRELEHVAKQQNRSMSDVVRNALKKQLPKEKKQTKKTGTQALMEWTSKAVKGPGDGEYDKYIYDFDYENDPK